MEGRRGTTNLNYLKLQHGEENYLNSLDISLKNPKGGIYRHQGKGGQGDNPWPKARAQPRPYGRGNVALPGWRASGFLLRTVPSVPCQLDLLIC